VTPPGMLVTDFDGTLRNTRKTIGERDLATLRRLGREGYVRTIATGRSLHSLFRAIDGSFPVDYVLFSSGAGVLDFARNRIIRSSRLARAVIHRAARLLQRMGLDFMVHLPIPENHRFLYHASGRENPDFEARRRIYEGHGSLWSEGGDDLSHGSQIVVIEPPSVQPSSLETLRARLSECSVIRATSPLDGESRWIEIFPSGISKGDTADWLAGEVGLGSESCMAVGNDYNDLDLLEWAGRSFVVAEAPEELRRRFEVVAPSVEAGVSDAVHRWLIRAPVQTDSGSTSRE